MSKLRSLPYAVLTMGLLAAGSASAQSMWSIDQREATQQQRINEGRRDGSLTRSEASRLQHGDSRNDRHEARTEGQRSDAKDRGNHKGRDNNRGNHYGRDGNPGNHYGWDNNRGNHSGWSNNDRNHGRMIRPGHSTQAGPQSAQTSPATNTRPAGIQASPPVSQTVTSVNSTGNGGRKNRR